MALDPLDDDVLYVAFSTGPQQARNRHGLWRSDDRGLTWTRLSLGTEREIDRPVAVRISPVDGTIYVLTRVALHRSADRGSTWFQHDGPANYVSNTDLLVDPHNAGTIYVAQEKSCGFGTCIEGGVKRSDDRGKSWRDVGLKKLTVSQLAADPHDASTLHAVSEGKLYQTRNRGSAWKAVTPLGASAISAVAVDPQVSSTIYTTGGTFSTPMTGIYKSTDRAQSWRLLDGDAFTSGGENVIAIDPHNPLQILATTGTGTLIRTTDGGESWQRFQDGLQGADPLQLIVGRNNTFHAIAENGLLFHYEVAHPRRRAAEK